MTDRPPLTLQTIRDRQRAVGLREYGIALEDAGLSRGRLGLHALEECVDLLAYLHTAKLLDLDDSVCLLSIAERLLPIADHPKPLPPDVPTVEAVNAGHRWWQLGSIPVWVTCDPDGDLYWARTERGGWDAAVDATDPRWRGPITLRP